MPAFDPLFADSLRHCHRCVTGLEALHEDFGEARLEPGVLMAAAVYARAAEYLKGSLELASRCQLLSSHTLARSAVECHIVLAAIKENADLATAMVTKNYLINEVRSLNYLRDKGYEDMASGEPIADRINEVERLLAQERYANVSRRFIDLVNLSGQNDMYRSAYSLLSDRAHAASMGSFSQDQVFEDRGQLTVRMSHEDTMGPSDIMLIADIALDIWGLACDVFSADKSGLNELKEKSRVLFEAIRART